MSRSVPEVLLFSSCGFARPRGASRAAAEVPGGTGSTPGCAAAAGRRFGRERAAGCWAGGACGLQG